MKYTASVQGFITVFEERKLTIDAASDAEAAEAFAQAFAKEMHADYPTSQDYGTLFIDTIDGKHMEICADGY